MVQILGRGQKEGIGVFPSESPTAVTKVHDAGGTAEDSEAKEKDLLTGEGEGENTLIFRQRHIRRRGGGGLASGFCSRRARKKRRYRQRIH